MPHKSMSKWAVNGTSCNLLQQQLLSLIFKIPKKSPVEQDNQKSM